MVLFCKNDCDFFYINSFVFIGSFTLFSPKGGQGCLMSSSCLESQGCHLIPLSYLLSCFFWLVLLLFLSCHFSVNGPFS